MVTQVAADIDPFLKFETLNSGFNVYNQQRIRIIE